MLVFYLHVLTLIMSALPIMSQRHHWIILDSPKTPDRDEDRRGKLDSMDFREKQVFRHNSTLFSPTMVLLVAARSVAAIGFLGDSSLAQRVCFPAKQ
jgi:hypothetical protein